MTRQQDRLILQESDAEDDEIQLEDNVLQSQLQDDESDGELQLEENACDDELTLEDNAEDGPQLEDNEEGERMLEPSTRVRIIGLIGRPELNGLTGQVLRFDVARGRHVVQVQRETVLLKLVNLTALNLSDPEYLSSVANGEQLSSRNGEQLSRRNEESIHNDEHLASRNDEQQQHSVVALGHAERSERLRIELAAAFSDSKMSECSASITSVCASRDELLASAGDLPPNLALVVCDCKSN